jgi:two-component system, OmpR family, phosphate regulon sensor histidine kinase PhoR
VLTFRQKLFLSYLIVFLVFLGLLFPFAARAVRGVVNSTLSDRTSQVIERVISAPSEEAMVQRLNAIGPTFFFRVSLITPDGKVLYDSHIPDQVDDPERYLKEHPELTDALKHGSGTYQGFSYALNQKLVYVAKRFTFQGKTYIIRTAFPVRQVDELTERFEFGFFTLGFVVLLLFGIMTSAIAHHLSRPIQKIITTIRPYQEGQVDELPEIDLGKGARGRDEFTRLAETLNSLNRRIQAQINTLKEERNSRAAILEALGEGVIAVDDKLNVTYANSTALHMLGITVDTLIGHRFSAAGHDEFTDLLSQAQQQGEMLAIASEIGDKKKIYLDVIALPLGSQAGAILVLQDKSIHYGILEMRKAFIANASHELKTPITIIRGFAETIEQHPEMPVDTRTDVCAKIIRNCVRMESLIRNLLRLADIEGLPRGNLQSVSVSQLVNGCKAMTLSVYADAQIDIVSPPEELFITADPELLELAVTNLLDNAAKYSGPSAQITATISLDPAANMAQIDVTDNGPGIPEEDLSHIFDRFYTVDKAHSRKMGGSGLGLSIVRTIVEKHLGRVAVTSTLGQGTTFTIRLPLEHA